MYLKTLHLRQFRNYLDQTVEFGAPKTILLGDNAQGKSNLLESVELLSTLRSHRTARDRDLIYTGKSSAQVAAQLERDSGSIDLAFTLRLNSRRTIAINSEAVRRQIDFLGILNMVQFSSLDLDLVRGGPEERRNWVDGLLIQLEPIYAHILQQYNQVLRQRNALLKSNQQSGQTEPRFDTKLEFPPPHTPHPTPHTLLPNLPFGMPSLLQPERGSFDDVPESCSGWLHSHSAGTVKLAAVQKSWQLTMRPTLL